jgi:hypothetical protein
VRDLCPFNLAAIFFLGVGLLTAGTPESTARETAPTVPDGRNLISADTLISSVRWLADDAREGRMTGTPGAEAAARRIAERFQTYGLSPGGDDGSFMQSLTVSVSVGFGDTNDLSIRGVDRVSDLHLGQDYVPFSFSDNGTVSVPIVFAGYGITAKNLGYDDYEGLDVEGKAVLVLRHEPRQDDPKSVFNGTENSRHAFFRDKARNAREHGAAAMLLFTGPASKEYLRDRLGKPDWGLTMGGESLMAAHVKHRVGEALLETAGVDVGEWVEVVDETLEPNSFELGPDVGLRLVVVMEKDRRQSANVVGLLPGTDSEAGAVVVGAHYDHLGLGDYASMTPAKTGEIHNGADDNASGTAVLVEMARVFSTTSPMRRTLVFAAFTGEEMGLQGSAHMARIGSPVPVDEIQAMINVDMVGRPRNHKVLVGGVETSPQFEAVLDRIARGSFVELKPGPMGAMHMSDHASFYDRDVPVLFFFSGLHDDYHTPDDDWEKINPEGITETARIIYSTLRNLADRTDRVEFVERPIEGTEVPGEDPVGRGRRP